MTSIFYFPSPSGHFFDADFLFLPVAKALMQQITSGRREAHEWSYSLATSRVISFDAFYKQLLPNLTS